MNVIISYMANQVVVELRAKLPQREPTMEQEPPENPPPTNTPLALATGTPVSDTNMMTMLATMQANMEAMRLQMEASNQHAYFDYRG